jgi:endoglucanase
LFKLLILFYIHYLIRYTLHWYPNGAAWQDTQRQQIQTAKAAGLATFITEYGVAWDNVFYPDEAKKWYTFMDQNTLSYANWHVGSTPDGFGQFKDGTPASQIGSDTNLTDTGKLVKAQMVSLKNQGKAY